MKKSILVFGWLAVAIGAAAQAQEFIGGLTPERRPEGAPVITIFEQTPAWQAQARHGIAAPQTGIAFLNDQGAWYTPFIHPNSTGRYDIRGFYSAQGAKE